MLKVDTTNLGTLAVLRLDGRIVRGETETLRSAVQSISDVREFIFDLARVTTIDAAGLGMMLELRERVESQGVRFTLVNVTKPVRLVLEITRLDSVFRISSEVEFFPAVSHDRAQLASCA